jgi:hypothetical protein
LITWRCRPQKWLLLLSYPLGVRWNSPQLFHPGHQLTEREVIHGNCFSYARYSLFPIKGFIEMLLRSRLACFSASGQRLNQNF